MRDLQKQLIGPRKTLEYALVKQKMHAAHWSVLAIELTNSCGLVLPRGKADVKIAARLAT